LGRVDRLDRVVERARGIPYAASSFSTSDTIAASERRATRERRSKSAPSPARAFLPARGMRNVDHSPPLAITKGITFTHARSFVEAKFGGAGWSRVLEQSRAEDRAALGGIVDWGCVDRALCREMMGYMTRVLELVGAKEVRLSHPRCRADDEAECFFSLRWRGKDGS
jgi:hypothetical protein